MLNGLRSVRPGRGAHSAPSPEQRATRRRRDPGGRSALRRTVGLAAAALMVFMTLPLLTAGRATAQGTSDRSDWDVSPSYPICDSQSYDYYVTCLPDDVAPTPDTSLVYGQLMWSNGTPVPYYEIQPEAAAYANLAINGGDPFNEDDLYENEAPVFDGYFAFIISKTDCNSIAPVCVDSISVAGHDEGWIFAPGYEGAGTPFGSNDENGWPTDPADWWGPVTEDIPVSYGSSTNLGTIVVPSPPDISASCTADEEQPAGSVDCTAIHNSSLAVDDTQYTWDFDPSDPGTAVEAGSDVSYTFPGGGGDYTVELTADDGDDWTQTQPVTANTHPCGGSCLSVVTNIENVPFNEDDGYQHVTEGEPVTVSSTVTDENAFYPLTDVTPGPLEGSPNVVIDGPEPSSVSQLDPEESTTFTWTVSFTTPDSDSSNSSIITSATADIADQTDSDTSPEDDFITDPTPLLVNVQGPDSDSTVGDLVPFDVTVTNQTGDDLTDVGPTAATVVPAQVDEQGNADGADIDFSESADNPMPIPPTTDLGAGETADYTVYGVADTAGTATVDVSVSGTDPSEDTTYTEDGEADVTVDEANPQPPPGFVLSVDPPDPVVGQSFTVNATISNNSLDETGTEMLNVVNVDAAGIFPYSGLSGSGIGGYSGLSLPPGSSTPIEVYSGTATVAGTYSVVSYMQSSYATDTNTTSTAANMTFTVSDGLTPQSITFPDTLGTVTYGAPPQTVSPTASSGLPVTLVSGTPSVCSVSELETGGFSVTPVAVGTCAVSAQQAGDGVTWNAAPSVTRSFTINKVSQTVGFISPNPSPVLVGTTYTPTATATSGLPVVLTVDPSSGGACAFDATVPTQVDFNGVGTCTIDANQAGNDVYAAASQVQQQITVTTLLAPQTISFTSTPPANPAAGGSYALSATGGASGNTVIFSVDSSTTNNACSLGGDGVTVSFLHSGSCVIDANQAGDADYAAATEAQQTIAVGLAPQTISFTSTNPSPVVIGATYTPTAAATSGLPVVFSVDSSSTAGACAFDASVTTRVDFTGAGSCVIDANQAGNADYVAASQKQQKITVSKAPQTISFGALANKTLAQSPVTVSATATSGLAVSFTTTTPLVCASGGTHGATITLVRTGTCTVQANQAGNATYSAAPTATRSFTVSKASQTISFGALANKTLAQSPVTVSATATSGLAVSFTTTTPLVCASGGTHGATITLVRTGTCTVQANQAGNATYSAAPTVAHSFTVRT